MRGVRTVAACNVRVLAACLSAGTLLGCGSEDRSTYIGYVEAEYVYVAAPQPGWLLETPVREGDSVKAGDVLFALDSDQQQAQLEAALARAEEANANKEDAQKGARPDEIEQLEAQMREAEAALAEARSQYDRWMPLVREGNASAEQGDQITANLRTSEARVAAAKEAIAVARLGAREDQRAAAGAAASAARAAVDEAQWLLDQRRVEAKVAGRVEAVYYRKGEYVAAAAPVLSILPANALKIRFFVAQENLPRFAVGDAVSLKADGMDELIPAKISFIAAEAEFTPPVIYSVKERDKLVFMVEARPETADGLRPGLPVDVLAP